MRRESVPPHGGHEAEKINIEGGHQNWFEKMKDTPLVGDALKLLGQGVETIKKAVENITDSQVDATWKAIESET